MRIRPTGKQITLRPIQQGEKTGGGIVMPDTARKLLHEAVVIDIGPEVTKYKPDERVIYSLYAVDWVKLLPDGVGAHGEGEDVGVIDEEDLRGVVEVS